MFSYHGQPDALLASTGSVNQTGTYVFAVEPHAVGGQCSSKSSTYWRTDGGFDTMYSIWNSKAEPEDLTVTFQHGDAQSYLYPVHLDANGMVMLDIKRIAAKGQPDVNGHLLPLSVAEGSLLIENAAGRTIPMSIVMSGGIYNPTKATCGNVTETCNGCTAYYVTANPFETFFGASPTQMGSGCTMYNGINDGFSGSWSSGNASIISISTGGVASPMSAGATTLMSQISNLPVNMGTFTSYNFIPCQYTTASPVGQATVLVPTTLKVVSATLLPDGSGPPYGCGGSQAYGAKIDVKYQVLDQNTKPISSASMTAHEQGTLFGGTPFSNNIGPVPGYPTSSGTTAADGTFHDVRLGVCSNYPISLPGTSSTQNITILLNNVSYPVRSQTFTVTAVGSASFGHGHIFTIGRWETRHVDADFGGSPPRPPSEHKPRKRMPHS